MSKNFILALSGTIIGMLLSVYFLVYSPMKFNYETCGKVILCED